MGDPSSYTRANFGGLQESAQSFNTASNSLIGELDDLEKDLQQHLAQWSSEAQDYYRIAKDNWNKSAQRISYLLSRLPIVIQTAHDNYHGAEKVNRGYWES